MKMSDFREKVEGRSIHLGESLKKKKKASIFRNIWGKKVRSWGKRVKILRKGWGKNVRILGESLKKIIKFWGKVLKISQKLKVMGK